jgi:hypothetical protein
MPIDVATVVSGAVTSNAVEKAALKVETHRRTRTPSSSCDG